MGACGEGGPGGRQALPAALLLLLVIILALLALAIILGGGASAGFAAGPALGGRASHPAPRLDQFDVGPDARQQRGGDPGAEAGREGVPEHLGEVERRRRGGGAAGEELARGDGGRA